MGVGEASSGREEVEPRRLLSQWPSAPIDAIATRQIRQRKAIRPSPAISAAKTFFSTVGRAKIPCRDAHKTAGQGSQATDKNSSIMRDLWFGCSFLANFPLTL